MSAAAPAHTDGASAHARIWRARRFQWVRRRCKRQPTSQEAEAASSNTLLNALRVFSVIIGARLGTHSTSSGRLRRWARARVARLRRLLLCCLLHVLCCMFWMLSAARCLLHVVCCTLSAARCLLRKCCTRVALPPQGCPRARGVRSTARCRHGSRSSLRTTARPRSTAAAPRS
jgi:hypothetical protein